MSPFYHRRHAGLDDRRRDAMWKSPALGRGCLAALPVIAHSETVPELDERDLLVRATRAARRRWPGAEVSGLRPLQGGVSSLTFATSLSAPGESNRPTVLKVAPPGVPPVLHRDVLRQSRLLKQLGGIPGLAVPAVYLEDDGDPPFFGMELAPGHSYEPKTDVLDDPPTPEVVGARAHAAAGMLARMQSLRPADIGLADEPIESLADKVERWGRLLGTVDADIIPGHEDVHRRLLERLPESLPATLLHGDYRLGNMMFDGRRLSAVIDWEIWSVGDPRIDLAWLLMHTGPPHRFRVQDDANIHSASGMPTSEALLRTYLSIRPTDLPDLDWFKAYSCYMVVATIAVFVKRNRRKAEPDPVISFAGESLPGVLLRAQDVLSKIEADAG
jgi:aminoglycoside phosphotransferase (APT) family kinase protein